MQKEEIERPEVADETSAPAQQAAGPEAGQPQNPPEGDTASPLDEAGGVDLGALPDAAQLAAELDAARTEMDKLRDQALRAAAEAQNARQRADRDVEKARKYALEKFAEDLLPVHDSLAQALSVPVPEGAEAQLAPMREGIELTLKMLLDTLARFNIECIDPAGEPFNPELHEAMTMIENPDCEPNTVLDVFQKGFTLNGRLVRAAKVVVSRAPVTPVNEEV